RRVLFLNAVLTKKRKVSLFNAIQEGRSFNGWSRDGNVSQVDLSRFPANDADLVYLKDMRDLRALDLSGTRISDAGRRSLREGGAPAAQPRDQAGRRSRTRSLSWQQLGRTSSTGFRPPVGPFGPSRFPVRCSSS